MEYQIAKLLYESWKNQSGQSITWFELHESLRTNYKAMARAMIDRFYIEPKCPFFDQYPESDKKFAFKGCPYHPGPCR